MKISKTFVFGKTDSITRVYTYISLIEETLNINLTSECKDDIFNMFIFLSNTSHDRIEIAIDIEENNLTMYAMIPNQTNPDRTVGFSSKKYDLSNEDYTYTIPFGAKIPNRCIKGPIHIVDFENNRVIKQDDYSN